MKNNRLRLISLFAIVSILMMCMVACGDKKKVETPKEEPHVDYAGQVKLDLDSDSLKLAVQWDDRSHIDGDTTHFQVSHSFDSTGVAKIRYLAVNTPESTGRIEEWGKAASRYTKEKLSNAVSIVIEADGDFWAKDGNGRYLCWVWYQPEEGADYRCLNLDLLQAGLAFGSSSSEGRYGEAAVNALDQALREKLYVHSDDKDPDFPYDEAVSVTLKELRVNTEEYMGKRVTVEGIVSYNSNYQAYIEGYDNETQAYYGMQVFYGYNDTLTSVLSQGSLVRVVGVLDEHNGAPQVTSLEYDAVDVTNPANTVRISQGNPLAYLQLTPDMFSSTKTVMVNDEEKSFSTISLMEGLSVTMDNLYVTDIYTTKNSKSETGAMTITCVCDGTRVVVRTGVLKDDNGDLITQDAYLGKTINVRGAVEYYNGDYQIKVLLDEEITVVE